MRVAAFYGFGLAESGWAAPPGTRTDFVLSTKVGRLLRPGAGPELDAVFDFTGDGIRGRSRRASPGSA